MSEPKFTKGPWRVHLDKRKGTACAIVEDRTGDCVARTVYRFHRGERNANGNLIAAAPEMYEALDEALKLIEVVSRQFHSKIAAEILERGYAVMKKARGDE